MKLKTYISAAAAVFIGASAMAQSITPTVSVTREYEGKLLQADKPETGMAVPDSLLKFDLDFDYTVFSNPYKGSREFTPYLQDVRPESRPDDASRLRLRLGAGYTLHPTFDFVWTPRLKGDFGMSVYGVHRSYVGKYRKVAFQDRTVGETVFREASVPDRKDVWKTGYDTYTRAGILGSYAWETGRMYFDVNYMGIAARDSLMARSLHSAGIVAGVCSNRDEEMYFFYDGQVSYRFSDQSLGGLYDPSYAGCDASSMVGGVREHKFVAKAEIGPVLSYYHRVILSLDASVVTYGGSLNSHAGKMSITPKYVYRHGRWDIDAGVKVEGFLRPNGLSVLGTAFNSRRSQIVYPAVNINFSAVEDWLNIYAKVTGGGDVNPYSDMVLGNHWFNPDFAHRTCVEDGAAVDTPLLQNTVERVNASLGFNGQVGGRFSYDLFGGYANYADGIVDQIVDCGGKCLPGIAYADFHYAFAGLKYAFKSEDVEFHGSFNYRYTNIFKRSDKKAPVAGFEPSRFSADFCLTYNWKRRIFAGVSCEGALARRGHILNLADDSLVPGRLPAYVDLGVNLEYRVNNRLSVWAEGANLLNQSIQRCPLYVENGVNFTAGISLYVK